MKPCSSHGLEPWTSLPQSCLLSLIQTSKYTPPLSDARLASLKSYHSTDPNSICSAMFSITDRKPDAPPDMAFIGSVTNTIRSHTRDPRSMSSASCHYANIHTAKTHRGDMPRPSGTVQTRSSQVGKHRKQTSWAVVFRCHTVNSRGLFKSMHRATSPRPAL